jgi:NAD(P)-dependent dehydrogenase (short-subunit alcohol dehydrogenase family)
MPRTIIISGANNGIRLAMTRALLEMGDRVAALGLSLSHLEPASPNFLPYVCNVTNPQRVQSVVDEVVAQWGGHPDQQCLPGIVLTFRKASFG